MDKMKTMQNMFISHESRMLSWMRSAFIACIFCILVLADDVTNLSYHSYLAITAHYESYTNHFGEQY